MVLSATPVAQLKVMLHAPGVEVDVIQKGCRLQSIEGCGWCGVVLMCSRVCGVCCVVWCGVEDEVSQRKEKEGSLFITLGLLRAM